VRPDSDNPHYDEGERRATWTRIADKFDDLQEDVRDAWHAAEHFAKDLYAKVESAYGRIELQKLGYIEDSDEALKRAADKLAVEGLGKSLKDAASSQGDLKGVDDTKHAANRLGFSLVEDHHPSVRKALEQGGEDLRELGSLLKEAGEMEWEKVKARGLEPLAERQERVQRELTPLSGNTPEVSVVNDYLEKVKQYTGTYCELAQEKREHEQKVKDAEVSALEIVVPDPRTYAVTGLLTAIGQPEAAALYDDIKTVKQLMDAEDWRLDYGPGKMMENGRIARGRQEELVVLKNTVNQTQLDAARGIQQLKAAGANPQAIEALDKAIDEMQDLSAAIDRETEPLLLERDLAARVALRIENAATRVKRYL
jgi:hypothetical protein